MSLTSLRRHDDAMGQMLTPGVWKVLCAPRLAGIPQMRQMSPPPGSGSLSSDGPPGGRGANLKAARFVAGAA